MDDLDDLGFDPVKFVRKRYCEKAVESNAQLNYIEQVTGCITTEKAAKVGVVTTYNYSGGSVQVKKPVTSTQKPSNSKQSSTNLLSKTDETLFENIVKATQEDNDIVSTPVGAYYDKEEGDWKNWPVEVV